MNVNHIKGKIYQVLGYESEQELDKALEEDKGMGSELKLFMSVYYASSESMALSAILSAVTGLDLSRPSQVAEYVVKNVSEGERRGLVQEMMAIQMTEFLKKGKGDDVMAIISDILKPKGK